MKKNLIFLELNEINFDFVNYYIKLGYLQNWKSYIGKYGLNETFSEIEYKNIEPWIQWPTIRSGKDFSDHKIFHLGDAVNTDLRQHWEIIEDMGYTVAAISPINAKNNTSNSPFWIPDPWVTTPTSGGKFFKKVTLAVSQAVNDNSKEKISVNSLLIFIILFFKVINLNNLFIYCKILNKAVLKRYHWSKAIFFDRLLFDFYLYCYKKFRPDFSVLFLNGVAHIQHHYFFNSPYYSGTQKNPSWYINKNQDPLLDILIEYDKMLADLSRLENTRIIIATALRQIPYEDNKFYWRLRDHKNFINKCGIKNVRISPRMTRDFLIEFDSNAETVAAYNILNSITDLDGNKIFGMIDLRYLSMFVTLDYDKDIKKNFQILINGNHYYDFRKDVVFVAIKNGHHDGKGYFIDTDLLHSQVNHPFPIKNIFHKVIEHFKY